MQYLVLLGRRNVLPVLAFLKYMESCSIPASNVWVARSPDSTDEWNAVRAKAPRIQSLEIDPIDGDRIRRQVSTWARSYDQIHLHYTGGTMAMAIHAVRALAGKLCGRSYLSADTRQILADTGELCTDSRRLLSCSASEIVELHGYPPAYHNQAANPTRGSLSAEVLRSFLDNRSFQKEIRDLRSVNSNNLRKDSSIQFTEAPPAWFDPALHKRLVKEFGTGALKYLVRFEFLEYAVYGECLEHCPVAMHSFKIPIGKRSRDPEIDVVFSIGYELWCVSCTVDDTSSLCYHKGAEILHHARRFGGDGARALLICLADVDTTSELAGLLKRNMGTASPMIRVWGRCEVADLKTQISKLFTQEGTKPCACS